MCAKKNELTKPSDNELTVLPQFMVQDEYLGLDELEKFITPPRLKLVQPQSSDMLKSVFNEGDTVMVPQLVLVADMLLDEKGKSTKKGRPFHFCPIFFFPEWIIINPFEMKGTLNFVRERSTDVHSQIAIKARSRDSKARYVPCPENPSLSLRYVEVLNYVALLVGEGITAGSAVIMSFSKSEHRTGETLNHLVKMRKAPIFGGVYEARAAYRTNDKGNWYGWDVCNPSEDSGISPWVPAEMYDALKAQHLEFKLAHHEARLVVDHDSDEVYEETPTSTSEAY